MSLREKTVTEKEKAVDKIIEDKVQTSEKLFKNLQDDHKNRCHKMESLEKDKIDLKKKNILLEKELLKLSEENLALIKENQAVKRGK